MVSLTLVEPLYSSFVESRIIIIQLFSILITSGLFNLIDLIFSGACRFKKAVWEGITQQLSRVALYTTLFQSDFTTVSSLGTDKLIDIFTQCVYCSNQNNVPRSNSLLTYSTHYNGRGSFV